jgi:hypothetical protein
MVNGRSGKPPGFAMLSCLTLHSNPCPPASAAVDAPLTKPAIKTPADKAFTIFTISSVELY